MPHVFRRWPALPLLFLCSVFTSLPAVPEATPRDARPALERVLREESLTGVVWSLLDLNAPTPLTIGAAGLANARTGERLTPEHRVHVGSIVKTLLTTGLLRLVTEGRVALDTPVATLLPALRIENPWAATDPLRLRHLLDHTSGLDDARLWQVFSARPAPNTPLSEGLGHPGEALRLRCRPGSRHSYSNTGYTVAGMILEALTGQRYESYLEAHLLRPLGLTESTFEFVSQTGPQGDPRLAYAHFENGAPQAAVPSFLRPAGQFTTTARDMARFAQFLLGEGQLAGKPFIAESLLRQMGRPQDTEAAQAGLATGYALGLAGRDFHGARGLAHGGDTVGYRALLWLFPEERKAFFFSANCDHETARYRRIDAALCDALGVARPAPAPVATAPADVADWTGLYRRSPSRFEMFDYLDALSFARVTWDGRQLHLHPFQGATRALEPLGGRLFRAQGRSATSHVLYRTMAGAQVISDGQAHFERTSALLVVALWLSFAAGVLGLLWLLCSGLVRLVRRRDRTCEQPHFLPFLSTCALLLPVPFFLRQSFLQIGDLTFASALTALATGLLPVAMLVGLWRGLRRSTRPPIPVLDALAMLGVLQWSAVLAAYGLLPLRLWA